MGWDNVTGDARVLPTGGGSQDEIKFETNQPKRMRLLAPNGEQPYSYLEHCLEVEAIEGDQVVRTFRTIRCPKTTKSPNAPCPLCDGQQVRRRLRHAMNAWDYDLQSVQKLNAGEAIFKPIATTRKLNIDITAVDWAVLKTGKDRNDTEYSATNLGPTPFTLQEGTQLFNMELEYAPHSIDEMRAIVEGAGGNWDKLIVPPDLQYPSLQEALEHEMPNGKNKGMKFKAMWEQDKSNRGMIYFLGIKSDRVSPEKACAQVILANLGGIPIPGVPIGGQVQPVQQVAQQVQQTPVQQPTAQTTQATATAQVIAPNATPSNDRQEKINKVNSLFSTKDAFVKGGFTAIIETMKKASDGKTNIVDFTDTELDAMLKLCEEA